MHYYPVLLDLRDRRCVVIGGGVIAEGKVTPLVAAGAQVTVVSPALTPGLGAQHRAGRFAWVERAYEAGDLAGAYLVIAATDDAEVNHRVHAEAEARSILVNVVDDPPYCGFILPSILRRGELIVAVSTSGNAPALAVRLRERIEREVGPEHARFLELAGSIRAPLARKYPAFNVRKELWYRLVDSDVLALLRAGREAAARERIASIMGVEVPSEPVDARGGEPLRPGGAGGVRSPGTVYLVGAGPGDPKLVTARGLEVLRRADVVVYDRLVSPALLDEAPAEADLVYVGKAPGGHCMTQEGINDLLVAQARFGRTVVRLKGGDPFVFGRGAEEARACADAGVPWEVVPGVSSVLGATASAAIPVTARGTAGAFAVVTAHRAGEGDDGLEWSALARIETLVVLMGVERLPAVVERLTAHGRAAETPVAVIENGTLPTERVVTGTLADIVARAQAEQVRPPAIIVVGEVVRLRESLGRAVAGLGAMADSTGPAAEGARHVA
ncbi:MAG TPA: siroheme synthase CysG [Gemmatimonadales bacterium]|nr:siroheme synthase CysG [Gemmatimonadales bacterium]